MPWLDGNEVEGVDGVWQGVVTGCCVVGFLSGYHKTTTYRTWLYTRLSLVCLRNSRLSINTYVTCISIRSPSRQSSRLTSRLYLTLCARPRQRHAPRSQALTSHTSSHASHGRRTGTAAARSRRRAAPYPRRIGVARKPYSTQRPARAGRERGQRRLRAGSCGSVCR